MPEAGKPNIYELAGREKKAAAMLDAILSRRLEDVVPHFDARMWGMLADIAGVPVPSDETIALVKERLAARKGGPR